MKRMLGVAKKTAAVLLGALFLFAAGCKQNSGALPESCTSFPDASATVSSQESTAGESSETASAPESTSPEASSENGNASANAAQSKAPQSSQGGQTTRPSAPSGGESTTVQPTSSRENSPAPPPAASNPPASSAAQKNEITVHIVVECKTAAAQGNAIATDARIAKDGVMCDETLTLKPGATVYDALMAAKSLTLGRPLVVNGASSGFGMYISAIQSLAERACGAKSGWLYFVNNVSPGVACSETTLNDGDQIEWRYTCDGGNDVK